MYKYPQATYKIIGEHLGKTEDITDVFGEQLISLTIQDKRGLEMDTLQIDTADSTGNSVPVEWEGVKLKVWLGWEHIGLVYKGSFTITEVRHSGPPDIVSIKAVSIDLEKGFKQKRERSWHNKTIGDVIMTIANDYGMIVKVHENLRDTKIAHIDQNESDASFISRIATEHNAIATVKNNHLLFLPKNQGFTANGLQLPTYTIARTMCDSHDFVKKYSEISNVVTSYHSFNSATPIKRMASIGSKQQNIKEIRHIFKDEVTADNHAVAELNRMLTNTASLSLNLTYGIPDLIPETPLQTVGFKEEMDNIVWVGVDITHRLDTTGYTTQITAEPLVPDVDDFILLSFDAPTEYTGVVAYHKYKTGTQKVMIGDMTYPKRLTYLYINEYTATAAINREWVRIQAEKGIEVKPHELRKVRTKKAQSKRKTKKTTKKSTKNQAK